MKSVKHSLCIASFIFFFNLSQISKPWTKAKGKFTLLACALYLFSFELEVSETINQKVHIPNSVVGTYSHEDILSHQCS